MSNEQRWAGRSMLIKYDHLNPEQFATLAAFLETPANIVAAPTGRMFFDYDHSVEGEQPQASFHRFARLVKAEQKSAPVDGASVTIEVMVMLLMDSKKRSEYYSEYYAVPFSHLQMLIGALGLFPPIAEKTPRCDLQVP